MATPGNFTTLAASGTVTFGLGATSGYYWTCSNSSGDGLWAALPSVGNYSSINLTAGATIGKVWQCTNTVTGAGAWVSIASLSTGGALTVSNDTNITATLSGSNTTALFTPVTINLAWLGTLAPGRGGTGYDGTGMTLGDLLYASTSSTMTRLPGNTTSTRKFLMSVGSGAAATAPFWDVIQGSDIGNIITQFTSAGFGIPAQNNSHIATSSRTGVAGINYQIALGGVYTAINTTAEIRDLDITTTHVSSSAGLTSSEGICIENNVNATLGTIDEHCGIHIHPGTNIGGTVTSVYGAHIAAPGYGTNRYALWTEDITVGDATPYSLLAVDANNKVTSIAPYADGFATYVLTWTSGTTAPTWQVPTGGGGGGSGITSGTGTANQILLNGTTATQFSASTFSLSPTLIAPGSIRTTTTMAIVSAIDSTIGLLNGFTFTGAANNYQAYNSTGTISFTSGSTTNTSAFSISNIINTNGATITTGAGINNSPTLRNTSGTFTNAYTYYSNPTVTGTTNIGTYASIYCATPTSTGTITTAYTAYFASPPTTASTSVALWTDSLQVGGTASGVAATGSVKLGSASINASSLLATDSNKIITTTTSTITPTFAGLVLGTITGLLKATSGTISQATAGTDYEAPITGGTTLQYLRGDKSLSTFSTDVRAQISASGNLSYTTGNVTLNTTITGLTSVAATTFTGALTGNASTATALSTSGTANQFWKNGNVWGQPTQADISGLTTSSSPSFTGLTISGLASGDVLAYFNTSKALAAVTLNSNLTLTTGTLALNTTITGLTSVSSASFTGALTGNASTATALSTSGTTNQFWKNGNTWAQPTQADISGLTTSSSPSFTGLTVSGLATGDVLAYFNTSKALSAVTLNSNLTLTTGTLALNTTITGLTSVSSTTFVGALTGNASTATALSTAGSANQFWKNGNVWAQPAQADISGLTTSSSPSFTGVTVSGSTGDTLTYFNTSKALTSVTLSSNLTLTTGTLDTVQGIQTTSNPQFNSLGIGTAASGTAGYARINSVLGVGIAPAANNILMVGGSATATAVSFTANSIGASITGQASAISPTLYGSNYTGTYTFGATSTATGTITSININQTQNSVSGPTTVNMYGININNTQAAVSGPTTTSAYGLSVTPNTTAATGTLAFYASVFSAAGTMTGTITAAYGGYFNTPAGGSAKTALYAADCAIGTTATTPPTNGLLVAGPIKNTNISANTLTYADASQQLASVTLNSNITLTTGTLALNTTISGLTSVSSTSFTGALTGNASTATALSTAGTTNQFWKNGNVWGQPTQADISGLTTSSSPSFTGVTISGSTGDTLTYFNTSKALTSVTLNSNLTLTTGTLALNTTISGLTSVSSTSFTGALTGNASTATALSTSGSANQFWKNGNTWAQPTQADISGLTTSSSPTFTGLNLSGATSYAPLIVDNLKNVVSVTTGMSNAGYILTSNGSGAAPTWQVNAGSGGGIPSVTGTTNQILINGATSTVTSAATFTIDTTFVAPGSISSTTTIGIVSAASANTGLINGFTYSGVGGTNKTIETLNGSLSFSSTTTSLAAGLSITSAIGTTSNAVLTAAAGISNQPSFTANSSVNTSTFYGIYNNSTFTNTQASSAFYATYNNCSITLTANLSDYYGEYVGGSISSGTGTLSNMYGIYVDVLTKATGTVTIAYGSYTKVPTAGTTNIATYTDNLAIGTTGTAPPNNGLLVSGVIKNTNLSINTLTYADGSSQLASVTLNSNLTLTTGTLALNTTISGLTSVSSTTFVGALTGNASTATALSTAGSANQFWKNGNVWAQPAQADISGLTTSSSPTFTGITLSGATGDTLTYFNTSKALTSVTLNSNLTLTTGTLALNTTITGLTSVSSTTFVGALTGNASTATALSTSGAANQFWKNGNVWAQPTQSDISGLTTGSSPSFTGLTISGITGDTLTYFNTSKALTSVTLNSNLTLTTGTLALNTTISGLTSVSSTGFTGALTGNASTATALSTAGSANQFWKNGNVWAQPTQADISGLTTSSSPTFVGLTLTGFVSNLLWCNGSSVLSTVILSSNFAPGFVGTLDLIQDIQTTSTPRFAGLALGAAYNSLYGLYNNFSNASTTTSNYAGYYSNGTFTLATGVTNALLSGMNVSNTFTTNNAGATLQIAANIYSNPSFTNTSATSYAKGASIYLAQPTISGTVAAAYGIYNNSPVGATLNYGYLQTGTFTKTTDVGMYLNNTFTPAANSGTLYQLYLAPTFNSATNTITDAYCVSFTPTFSVSSAVTNVYGLNVSITDTINSASILQNSYGIKVGTVANGSSSTAINNAYNLYLNGMTVSGSATITNGYGIYNSVPTGAGTNIGHRQAGTFTKGFDMGLYISDTFTPTGGATSIYDLYLETTVNTTSGAIGTATAERIAATFSTTSTSAFTTIYGSNMSVSNTFSAVATTTDSITLNISNAASGASAGIVTNMYGIKVNALTKSGSATVTNAYGGYFTAPTAGGTKNIALFADDISLGSSVTASTVMYLDANKKINSVAANGNTAYVLTNTSPPTWAAAPGGGSGVPSVTGTTNQILINGGTSAVTTAATFTIPSTFVAPGTIQATSTMGVGTAPSTDFGIKTDFTYTGAIPLYIGGNYIGGTMTFNSGTPDTVAGLYNEPTFDFQTGVSTSYNTTGIYNAPWFKSNSSVGSNAWSGIYNAPYLTNNTQSDYYCGLYNWTKAVVVADLTTFCGVDLSTVVSPGSSGTVTDMFGLRVNLTVKSAGTVTTAYGAYINNPTAGTSNIALFAANANLNYAGVAPPSGGMIMSGKLGVGNNNPTNQLEVTGTARFSSSVICATGALTTSATDGFIYIPTCAGIPTGVPTSQTGTCAMAYDTTNNDLYIYDGAWQKSTLNAAGSSDTFETINNNNNCYPYSLTYDGSNRYSTITYTAPGGSIVKTFSYNGDGTINTIVLSGAGLPTITYTTKTYTHTSGSLTSVAYS